MEQPNGTGLTKSEKEALLDGILRRARADLNDGKPLTEMAHKSTCNCPIHRLSKEERAARIDKAIDETTEQFRKK